MDLRYLRQRMSPALTRRQVQVFDFLQDYHEQHGRSPTLQEISDHFGFRSPASAQQHIRLIEQKGFLTRTPHSSRSIRVVKQEREVEPSQMIAVPLVGKIAAGLPIFALEEAEEVFVLPRKLFRGRSLFALRVEGDSMTKAGIFDGDIAVLRKQPDFTDGDIAAVIVDEEATLKRLFRTSKGLRLHPENDAHRDRIIPAAQADRACRVAGILVGTIRRF